MPLNYRNPLCRPSVDSKSETIRNIRGNSLGFRVLVGRRTGLELWFISRKHVSTCTVCRTKFVSRLRAQKGTLAQHPKPVRTDDIHRRAVGVKLQSLYLGCQNPELQGYIGVDVSVAKSIS